MSKERVVSLSPSCTEIICALGCADRIVGRSHLCDFPPEITARPACTAPALNSTGSSADIDLQFRARSAERKMLIEVDRQQIAALKPDLVLSDWPAGVIDSSVTGNTQNSAVVPPVRMPDLWANIHSISAALGVEETGNELLTRLKNRLVDIITKTCVFQKRPTVVCLGWIQPLMTAGFWIPELVGLAGGQSLFAAGGTPSAPLDWTALSKSNPDTIVAMPCGFDLARTRKEMAALEQRPEWGKLGAVRSKQVFVTDASQFLTRPGPRLVESVEILAQILHPKTFHFGGEGKKWQKME